MVGACSLIIILNLMVGAAYIIFFERVDPGI